MDHQPLRLVDDNELVILEHHVERDVLRPDLSLFRGWKIEHDPPAGVDAVTGIADRGAVDRDATRQDQLLVARARQLGHARGQHAVEPLAGFVSGDHQFLAAPHSSVPCGVT
jgi:hypothetical protein